MPKAFETGLQPDDVVDDNRLRPDELPAAYGRYDPSNSDNTYRGELPARDGLVLSRNTMSVRIGLWTGLDPIREIIVRAGIITKSAALSFALSRSLRIQSEGFDRVLHSFRHGGVKLQPYLIEHIADPDGQTIYKATRGKLDILDPEAARVTASLMQEVLSRGTAIPGAATRTPSHSRGKNRDHRRLPRRVVRRIRRSARMRGLGRLRSAEKDHARRDGRRIGSSDLGGHRRGQTGAQMNPFEGLPQIALRNKGISNNIVSPLRRDDLVRDIVKIPVATDERDP